jgi:hypothetical protein
MPARSAPANASKAAVLTKALVRAGDELELRQSDLAAILGVSAAQVSRFVSRQALIDPTTKVGELALLLLRVFRSLDTLVGGRPEKARAWLATMNHHLGGVPTERLKTVEGLTHVADYLDAMRGSL